jgi:hypothetical protein
MHAFFCAQQIDDISHITQPCNLYRQFDTVRFNYRDGMGTVDY